MECDKNKCSNEFEKTIKEYLKQASTRLGSELMGTREAISLIAQDKTKEFIKITDKGLDSDERDCLRNLIISSMVQSFCFGYGIGKVEGTSGNKVFL